MGYRHLFVSDQSHRSNLLSGRQVRRTEGKPLPSVRGKIHTHAKGINFVMNTKNTYPLRWYKYFSTLTQITGSQRGHSGCGLGQHHWTFLNTEEGYLPTWQDVSWFCWLHAINHFFRSLYSRAHHDEELEPPPTCGVDMSLKKLALGFRVLLVG